MLDGVPEVTDGTISVPDEPGWGVSVDEAWLADAEHRQSSL